MVQQGVVDLTSKGQGSLTCGRVYLLLRILVRDQEELERIIIMMIKSKRGEKDIPELTDTLSPLLWPKGASRI